MLKKEENKETMISEKEKKKDVLLRKRNKIFISISHYKTY